MGQYIEPENWVSLDDYINKGVRKKAEHETPIAERLQMPPEPESWVSEQDFYVNHVRKSVPTPSEESYIVCLEEPLPKPTPPPEAGITIFEALDEVMAPTQSRELEYRLIQMAKEDLREFEAGLINHDELERRRVASSIIQDNHNRRKERIADWYLETYFRIFENPKIEDN